MQISDLPNVLIKEFGKSERFINEFSNEQREQVDASKLYSTLLLLGGYQEGAGEVIPDSNEAEELQNKINALANVQDIAETTDINELGCANYCYSNAETTVMIPENQQDDIFLDVLELSETVSEIEPGYAGENFDLEPLSSLVMFFTSGYSAKASGILDSDDPFSPVGKFGIYPTKGSYTADAWDPAHYSSRFSLKATMKDKDTGTDEKHNTVAYCANPSRARYHKGSQKTTKFKASDLKEIANGVDNMAALKIKLILWYGFDGPGYGKDGAPKVSYAATHFALGKEYANDTGDESKTHASKTKWKELYNFAKEKAKDIKKDRLDLPSTGKLGKDEIDFLNFRVFVVVPPDSEKYQHIFFYSDNAEDQSIDPMQLYLYKVEDDSTKGTKVAGSTLVKAEFVVKFYLDQEYTSAKTAKKQKADATWTFSTKNVDKYVESLGDEYYDNFPYYSQFADAHNDGSKYPTAGIDFAPKNQDAERGEWKNPFLTSDNLESYNKYCGQKGTYVIYEKSASEGFKIAGQMKCLGSPETTTVTNLKEGIAIYYEPGIGSYRVNGEFIKYGVKEDTEGNKDDPDTEGVIEVAETQTVPGIKTNAGIYRMHLPGGETQPGTQYAKADGRTIRVNDEIVINNNGAKNAEYTLTTYLFDKTANKYMNIQWKNNVIGEVPEITTTPASATDGPSITKKFTSADVNASGEYKTSVNGDIVASPELSGHTLIFINKLKVKAGDETTTIETSKNETSEYIYLQDGPKPDPSASTSIISSQIQRKRGTGESIVYAGKYTDNTFTSGGGEILQSITDTIEYSKLTANKQYTIKAWLADADTGEKAVDAGGNEIKTETTQTASGTGSGSWDIKFDFDATGLGGKKYVAFIEIYDGSTKKFDLKDKNNKFETFFIPGIETKLTDSDNGSGMTAGGSGTLLIDKITYNNLLPGVQYKVVSSLVDAETGEVGTDANGAGMKCETLVTADAESGSFDIEMEFDINTSDAKVYVAFEEIFIEKGSPGSGNWVLVADHKDIMDKNQMTVVPGIKTFAKDQKTDGHLSYAEEDMVVYDTLHYENFVPGLKYRVDSELIDVATNKVVVDADGAEQKLTTYFTADENLDAGRYLTYGDITPDNHDGNGIIFELNGEGFEGKTFVVYERVYVEDEKGLHLVAEHTDPLDENQTIHIPKIWTNAIDIETQTNISYADETAIIKDTVSYENLIPGLTYELHGRVVDRKKTLESGGKEVVVVGSDGKNAENKVVFTPDTANGEQELTFDIDLKKYVDDLNKSYDGAVFVVYEDLYVIQRYDGADGRSIVASHTDINDENQTIYLPKITTSLDDAKTGTKLSYAEKDAHLVDTINYYNMKPSTQYTVTG